MKKTFLITKISYKDSRGREHSSIQRIEISELDQAKKKIISRYILDVEEVIEMLLDGEKIFTAPVGENGKRRIGTEVELFIRSKSDDKEETNLQNLPKF